MSLKAQLLVGLTLCSLGNGCVLFQRSPRTPGVPGADFLGDPLAVALDRARRGRLDRPARRRLAGRLLARAREHTQLGAPRAAKRARAHARRLDPKATAAPTPPARPLDGARLEAALRDAAAGRLRQALARLADRSASPEALRWRARLLLLGGQRLAALRSLGRLRQASPGGVRYLPTLLRDLAALGLVRAGERLARQLLHDDTRDAALLRPMIGLLVAAHRPDAARIAVERWAHGQKNPRPAFRYALDAWARAGDGRQTARWAKRLLAWDGRSPATRLQVVHRLRQAGRRDDARRVAAWARAHPAPGGAPVRPCAPAPRPATVSAYRAALAHQRRGDRAAAARHFARALVTDPARYGRPAYLGLATLARGRSLSPWIRWAILGPKPHRSCPR